jgi:hypothetical protein
MDGGVGVDAGVVVTGDADEGFDDNEVCRSDEGSGRT